MIAPAFTPRPASVTASSALALDELLPKLATLPEAVVRKPHVNPHASAVSALLVIDWLSQPEQKSRLSQVGLDPRALKELGRCARAIIAAVATLGGDYLSPRAISTELADRCKAVRASTMKELANALPYDRGVKIWLEAMRRGVGAVDLVYDLRTLAELLTSHSQRIRTSLDRLPALLLASADAIEYALRIDEEPGVTVARGRLARLWTLFVPAYERVATCARVLSHDQSAEQMFPPLALVAAMRRVQRRREEEKLTDECAKETGARRAHRVLIELEVGIESESNFYVGFTENLSSAGIFVATFVLKPIGSSVDIALTLPDGETMRVRGTVRWQRPAADQGWPGMGIHFDDLAPAQEARIRKFLALRQPILYEE